MNIIVVSDLHGKQDWKKIDPKKWDKIVFIGDYVDSFDHSDAEILSNLLEIIQFTKDNFEKVVLLIGNHDMQYLVPIPATRCSGYRSSMSVALNQVFTVEKSLFRIAYQVNNFLFTHAGISTGWLKENNKEISDMAKFLDIPRIESNRFYISSILNEIFHSRYQHIIFQVSPERGGLAKFSGPMWADKEELTGENIPENLIQVVGHTKVKDFEVHYGTDSVSKVFFTDVLDSIPGKFLELVV